MEGRVDDMVNCKSWVQEIERLAVFSECHPQAANSALTHGLVGRWMYAARTINDLESGIAPLNQTIRSTLVPAMLGRLASSDLQWDLLTLPTRLGGLGLPSVMRLAQQE